MQKTVVIFPLLVLSCYRVFAQFTFEIQQHFEFENAVDEAQVGFWVWRSEAYGLKTLRLEDYNRTYTVELTLCIEPYIDGQNTTVFVHDVLYSNDGPSDNVYIMIDNNEIGNFTTREKWLSGYKWNVFRNAGRVGQPVVLAPGKHILELEVETDYYGVELDRIIINADNQDPLGRLFCNATLYRKE